MLTIKTNNVPRFVTYGYELPIDILEDLGYNVETDEADDWMFRQFAQYRGVWYDIGDFITTYPGPWNHGLPKEFLKWDGYQSDSYFSGVLIRYCEDTESVAFATYYS